MFAVFGDVFCGRRSDNRSHSRSPTTAVPSNSPTPLTSFHHGLHQLTSDGRLLGQNCAALDWFQSLPLLYLLLLFPQIGRHSSNAGRLLVDWHSQDFHLCVESSRTTFFYLQSLSHMSIVQCVRHDLFVFTQLY